MPGLSTPEHQVVLATTRRQRREWARAHPRSRGQKGMTTPAPAPAPAPAPLTATQQARLVLYANMSEADWQATVEETLAAAGWSWLHVRDARRQHVAGAPDLLCFHEGTGRRLAIELKRERGGRLTAAQARWLAVLAACGFETHVLRPSQTDEMRALLLGDGGNLWQGSDERGR